MIGSKKYMIIFIINLFNVIKSNSLFDYSHSQNSPLSIQVGSLTSIQGVIPFNYYNLGLCKPDNLIKEEDNLGEILTGHQYYNTKYELFTNKNEFCKLLCTTEITKEKLKIIEKTFNKNYNSAFFLDRLPAGLFNYNPETGESNIDYFSGIPLGYSSENKSEIYIYNHFQFHIILNNKTQNNFEIEGFNYITNINFT